MGNFLTRTFGSAPELSVIEHFPADAYALQHDVDELDDALFQLREHDIVGIEDVIADVKLQHARQFQAMGDIYAG